MLRCTYTPCRRTSATSHTHTHTHIHTHAHVEWRSMRTAYRKVDVSIYKMEFPKNAAKALILVIQEAKLKILT